MAFTEEKDIYSSLHTFVHFIMSQIVILLRFRVGNSSAALSLLPAAFPDSSSLAVFEADSYPLNYFEKFATFSGVR